MQNDVKTINCCRVCGRTELQKILSLGDLYTSNFVDAPDPTEKKYPLELVLCNAERGGCGLLQLRHTVSNEILYRNYWYRSSTNQTMTNELVHIVDKMRELVPLSGSDAVLDIGCNDGTLLRAYGAGVTRVGFEPARNLVPVAKLNAEKVINDFFNFEAWDREFPGKRAKIITAIAMFYDLDDPNAFVGDVVRCLDDEGALVIQMSYLPLMLSQNAFDNVCHEHLEHYSFLSLERLLARHGFEAFDVELNDVNGGSFRIYIRHAGKGSSIRIPPGAADRVRSLRESEEKLGLNGRAVYDEFVRRVEGLKAKTVGFIREAVAAGKKVYVYGASTKGNTLLQFYGLDASLIPFAAERNQDKWGKKTVGSLIPIISEEQARADRPDYFFVLPWHFMEEFREREKEFLQNGGKFIVPLPEFRIIGA